MAVDPLAVFHEWFEAAREAGVEAPEVMTLATADADGRPSARMLLLKSADERGFTFFTGYESRKGRELAENPRAALVFYWRPLGRQVRVEGTVRRLPPEESDAYWATRPPRSRAAAAASRQGEPIESREALEAEFERLRPATRCRGPSAGAATCSSPTRSSSGSTATTACTNASGSRARARAGSPSNWRHSSLGMMRGA